MGVWMDPAFVEEIIIGVLRESGDPLTILQIAEKSRMHRVTASKYLAVLEAKGHVKRRDVGKAKLYSHNEIGARKESLHHGEEEE